MSSQEREEVVLVVGRFDSAEADDDENACCCWIWLWALLKLRVATAAGARDDEDEVDEDSGELVSILLMVAERPIWCRFTKLDKCD